MTRKEMLEGYLRDTGIPFEAQHHVRVITAQEVGAMPPFGNLYGITVCADKALTDDESTHPVTSPPQRQRYRCLAPCEYKP